MKKNNEKIGVKNPKILIAWDEKNPKNQGVDPKEINIRSNRISGWKCPNCGEYFEQSVHAFYFNPICPKCKKVIVPKANSLSVLRPELAKHYSKTKNNISPDLVAAHSNKHYFFECACGNIELRSPNKIQNEHIVCKHCLKQYQTSFFEQALFFYIKKDFPNAENRKLIYGKEVDVYISDLNIGIEYDGMKFHSKDRIKENRKKMYLNNKGIRLINVIQIPKKLIKDNTEDVIYIKNNASNKELNQCIKKVLFSLDSTNSIDVDISKDSVEIEKLLPRSDDPSLYLVNNFNDINLLTEFSKKNKIPLNKIPYKYAKKVWWKCSCCGYEWEASVYKRNINRTGCPACTHRVFSKGINDLQTTQPEIILKYWDFDKNTLLKIFPENYMASRKEIVYWKDENGKSYKDSIYNVVSKHNRRIKRKEKQKNKK